MQAVLADLDRDGLPELIASRYDAGVDVWHLLPHGRFGTAATVAVDAAPAGIAAGDLDGDGLVDLAVTTPVTSTITLLLNRGGGAFERRSVPWPAAAGGVALGDLDGDGALDLVAVSPQTSQVWVARGTGQGTFAPPTAYASGKPAPWEVAIADLDGDGRLDVIVLESPRVIPPGPAIDQGSVSIFRGRGDGTLLAPATFAAGTAPMALVVADLDGDGRLDVATAAFEEEAVVVLPGDGAGGLLAGQLHPVGNRPVRLAAGDVDGDGLPELVVNRYYEDVALLRNRGGAVFSAPEPYAAGGLQVAVADVTGDGAPDLVIASTAPEVLVQEQGRFVAPAWVGGLWSAQAVAGDLDGDGRPEAVVPQPQLGAVAIFPGVAGGFGEPVLLPAPGKPEVVALADVDGDGKLDLVYAGDEVQVRRNLGGGAFGPEEPVFTWMRYSLAPALADLDGDGFQDLVVSQDSVLSDGFEVLLNDGRGHFTSQGLVRAGGAPKRLAIGDVDGDGKPDIAVANWSDGTVSLFRGRGDGTFAAAVTLDAGASYPETIAIGDVTGDGAPDLVVGSDGDLWHRRTGPLLRVFPGGAGGPGAPVDRELPGMPLALALRDMDSDGRTDLVLGTNDGVVVLRAMAGGGLAPTARYEAPMARWMAILDLDGDLRPDLLVAGGVLRQPGKTAALYNRCLPW
jgi:hypothetical protein